ncbi:bifunctional hydroxymethylpyrimidine kinase/phosphomethylpyrimidine kinase [Rhizobium sp. L1K21]|uniref:bifunctional hydroxymethylpyrimidine kinase/phosphomethylpyrimidine kinase n=1 Tax=Rhizobium sp. L1K21 TaxID=2954933 RepID=UPI00209370C6|nr:bifunctional hydroxymethylpyrimidine kinase/phosphomethylpyrimidine kinase [Rhizobium sp. L1K21]MCO6188548.1 bifunctional hydroxymethylpyrimidine kinase/phosphomethylpyrimidine kinase [Rhizobium sp. L1K21]
MARANSAMAINGKPHVLIIAGSDSSGGAGIVRDIETVSAFGLKSCTAITAVTAQTHDRVVSVIPMSSDLVEDQMQAALAANNVRAIKIGMLANAAIASKVADVLAQRPDIPAILDPVLISSSGSHLLSEEGAHVLLSRILPICTLITPNLPEITTLTQVEADSHPSLENACSKLLRQGVQAVLAKGGHAVGEEAVDWLFRAKFPSIAFTGKRFSADMRGTGCILSAGIAAAMADGASLETAVFSAKEHLNTLFSTLANESSDAVIN